jgi:endonuclease-3
VGKPKSEPRAAWADTESPEQKKRRARLVFRRLEKIYPDLRTALDHDNPFQLLVATVLSAQSTDKMINTITPALFERWPRPEDFLASKPGEIEQMIHKSGFFNQKAKSIRGLCAGLVERFGGQVPRTMAELITLPGVARKTANVVLANAFGINEGIAVDTHVHRLSWRLAFSDHDDPVKVERELMGLMPRPKWFAVTHLLIEHGRAVCLARVPRCEECVVSDKCPASRLATKPPKRRTPA